MPIMLDTDTRVLVQGITGSIGKVQTRWMLECGTAVVSGVTPGRGGATVEGVPVFDTVAEAARETGANASVLFVPAPMVRNAFEEAVASGIERIVVVPEHVPVHDIMAMRALAERAGVFALGPTTPGVLVPGVGKMGIMPASLFTPGPVGIVSRSGTLAYEFAGVLTAAGIGQSTVLGMGADPVVLTGLRDILRRFEDDTATAAVVIVGEVGGAQEEDAAPFIAAEMSTPVAAFIAGRSAPPEKRMGHAGAIVRGTSGTAMDKERMLARAGVTILREPGDTVTWATSVLNETSDRENRQ
jgi:succinyl-CoA synthetase alpha subunit